MPATFAADLRGQTFGRLFVETYAGDSRWNCRCLCGREKRPTTTHLTSGAVRSCGCLAKELLQIRNAERAKAAIENLLGRFMSYVQEGDGCWLWTGDKFRDGYGKFKGPAPDHKTYQAHRFSFEHFIGPIPDGLLVCHRCDTPPCVRPDHLFTGTHYDNVQDAIAKGRR